MPLKSHISTGVADNSVSPARPSNCCCDLSFGTLAVPPLVCTLYADSACSGKFFLLLDWSILLIMSLILSILICLFCRMLVLERPHGFHGDHYYLPSFWTAANGNFEALEEHRMLLSALSCYVSRLPKPIWHNSTPSQLECNVYIKTEHLCLNVGISSISLRLSVSSGAQMANTSPEIYHIEQIFWTYDTVCIYYFYWNHRIKWFKFTTGKLYICNSLQNKILAFNVS